MSTSDRAAELLARAKEIGAYAAELELGIAKSGSKPDDLIHHLGDDTGRVITDAYRLAGAGLAAEVVDAYLVSFNAARARAGWAPLSREDAIHNLQWAILPQGITAEEQQEVRAAFSARG
ncbi:hypothetical protein ATK17_3956 [Branchiibius hedensis]|uniref:Uncharacterized protein n=1 Tax=Branchiibius hedensis TaxID=672460 RepID=A0A2Y9C6Y7_9MICO|nr:hypothetical protein [Branchiibius hedensis]PWJ22999.1 hypothetical protein ATK17_3889 [Branchiibius hedensis]PWJ23050.1 hypothetical protein ATK17_3941 [Branchiibius hedensis]PWJ23064.1 hypothetical protein ATK17_3956 [Branchiibius hedensis]SSA59075.1 hypothetical protein SAMN04489750_3889 [Branchiibius hedensis]SSA59126.1 hypothetical protein SAMN04489750_3941 [Branchiibius hedensis]